MLVARSGPALPCSVAELRIVFKLDEIRQHVVPAPAVIAKVAPLIVIATLAADDNEAVDCA
jgi:hypothetical protein